MDSYINPPTCWAGYNGKMNEREFHDSILKEGAMPVSVSVVRSRLLKMSPEVDLPASWKFYQFDEKR